MFLIRSGAIEGYNRLVAGMGGNPVKLMGEVGFSPAQMRNPNAYVSYSKLAELLEITALACDEPLFGLLLSRHQTSTVLGDIAVTVAQQPTVRDALTYINRFLYLHANGVHIDESTRGESVLMEVVFGINSPRGLNQLAQLSIGQLDNFLTELLALERPVMPLLLRQSASTKNTALDSATVARIEFESRGDGVRFPARWLERQAHRDEDALRWHFQQYVHTLEQRYPGNIQDQVRDIIGQLLPSGECRVERVAATLELHPRVLQKKLQAQASGYGKLLRQTRMDIAQQHLRYRSMTVTDLALNLGYAEVSVFSRNFKQWTGLSPRQWQNRH